MRILKDVKDVTGQTWSVIFVFDGAVPDWVWNSPGTILNWGGYENAVGFME